jgi:ABC-type Na+ efflux pump permease subunit
VSPLPTFIIVIIVVLSIIVLLCGIVIYVMWMRNKAASRSKSPGTDNLGMSQTIPSSHPTLSNNDEYEEIGIVQIPSTQNSVESNNDGYEEPTSHISRSPPIIESNAEAYEDISAQITALPPTAPIENTEGDISYQHLIHPPRNEHSTNQIKTPMSGNEATTNSYYNI